MPERHFRVMWAIDEWAETPEEAASLALEIQRDQRSTATVFQVTDVDTGASTEVDLEDKDESVLPLGRLLLERD